MIARCGVVGNNTLELNMLQLSSVQLSSKYSNFLRKKKSNIFQHLWIITTLEFNRHAISIVSRRTRSNGEEKIKCVAKRMEYDIQRHNGDERVNIFIICD